MGSGEAFDGVCGAVVDLDLAGVFEDHAAGEDRVIAEAAVSLVGGFRGQQWGTADSDQARAPRRSEPHRKQKPPFS